MEVVGLVIGLSKHSLPPSDLYLLHLAVADLLLAFTLPFLAISVKMGWVFGDIMCKAVTILQELSFYSSILFLTCISVDRYMVIVRAMEVRGANRQQVSWVVCAAVWAVGALLSLPGLFYSTFSSQNSTQMVCAEQYDASSADLWRLVTRILRHTLGFFMERIQASEEEIKTHLETIHACQIDGYWRVLDFDYEMKLLGHVTQLVDSESWSFNKVPLQNSLEELAPLEPKEMIEHCLNCYGKRYNENDKNFYALHEDKVCRGVALMLLQNAVKFNLREFQEVWQQSVPEGMSTRLDQLKSVALVDRTSRPETICLLRVEDLPEDTLERFNHLFTLREKWTEDDITPYIQDLCGEKQTTGALLTKYARSSMQNGIKVFNSRRPVAT